MVERFHRHLKGGLKARLVGSNWSMSYLLYFLVSERLSRKACRAPRLNWSMEQHSVYQETSSPTRSSWTLPRSYHDCVNQCRVNSSSLHSGTVHLILTFPLTSTLPVMSTSDAMPTSHHSPDPTLAHFGCSADQTNISPWKSMGNRKKSLLTA